MRPLLTNAGLFVILLLSLSGCDLFCDCEAPATPCLFTYDQLIYTPDGGPNEQVATPIFEGDQSSGKFAAQPEGLVIDSVSGAIDVNSSAAGEYTVVYTLDDGETTCETKVVIAEGPVKLEECGLSYKGDGPVFRPTDPSVSFFITPTFEGEVPEGRFTVEPEGLDIDTQTGVININTSEAGVQYYIRFVSTDGRIACETSIVIGGIDYIDRVYVLEDNEFEAVPIVDGINEEVRGVKGFFDEAALFELELGQGQPSAASRGLEIDNRTGIIDLQQTIVNFREEGVDLVEEPTRDFEIFYTLEAEPTFLNSLKVQIFYYETVSDIPQGLIALLNEKQRYPINGREERERPTYIIIVGMR
ncbi:MAG: hypothetical protein WA960_20350 [Tunicatimonas sp.]